MYHVRLENLPAVASEADIRRFFDFPTEDVLPGIELLPNGSAAILQVKLPEEASAYLRIPHPTLDGNHLSINPDIVSEMSVTINDKWLRMIESSQPNIRREMQTMATDDGVLFQSRLETQSVSLTGQPWKVEKLITVLEKRFRDVICDCGQASNQKAGSNPTKEKRPRQLKHGNGTREDENYANHETSQLESDKGRMEWEPLPSGNEEVSASMGDGKNIGRNCVSAEASKHFRADERASENSSSVTKEKKSRVLKSSAMDTSSPVVADVNRCSSIRIHSCGMSGLVTFTQEIRLNLDENKHLLQHVEFVDFKNCSRKQKQVSDEEVVWMLASADEACLQEVVHALLTFRSTAPQRKTYWVPDAIDFQSFQSILEATNDRSVTLNFDSKDRKCVMVGQENRLESTWKWITDTVDGMIGSPQSSSMTGQSSRMTGQSSSMTGQSSSMTGQGSSMTGQGSSMTGQGSSMTGQGSRMTGQSSSVTGQGFSAPRQNPDLTGFNASLNQRRRDVKVTHELKDDLVFTVDRKLMVFVHLGDMVKQQTEAIVNPANGQLVNGAGLAKVISCAGGSDLDDECRKIMSGKVEIPTGTVVYTSAGNLPKPIRHVIHAVGPMADQFEHSKQGLFMKMAETFLNCLHCANTQLHLHSISIPPISSGIFGVPIDVVIEAAFVAIQLFCAQESNPVIEEIHVISNEQKATEDMVARFRTLISQQKSTIG